jgi:hypothetical protein
MRLTEKLRGVTPDRKSVLFQQVGRLGFRLTSSSCKHFQSRESEQTIAGRLTGRRPKKKKKPEGVGQDDIEKRLGSGQGPDWAVEPVVIVLLILITFIVSSELPYCLLVLLSYAFLCCVRQKQ